MFILNLIANTLDFFNESFRYQLIRLLVLGGNSIKGIPYLQTASCIHNSRDRRNFHIEKLTICSIEQFGFQNILFPSNCTTGRFVVININDDVVVGKDVSFQTRGAAESVLSNVVIVFVDCLEFRFHKLFKVTRIAHPDKVRLGTVFHHPYLDESRTVTVGMRRKFFARVQIIRNTNCIGRINVLCAIEVLRLALFWGRRILFLRLWLNWFRHIESSQK